MVIILAGFTKGCMVLSKTLMRAALQLVSVLWLTGSGHLLDAGYQGVQDTRHLSPYLVKHLVTDCVSHAGVGGYGGEGVMVVRVGRVGLEPGTAALFCRIISPEVVTMHRVLPTASTHTCTIA